MINDNILYNVLQINVFQLFCYKIKLEVSCVVFWSEYSEPLLEFFLSTMDEFLCTLNTQSSLRSIEVQVTVYLLLINLIIQLFFIKVKHSF